jgi:hypothetical protein
MLKLGVGNAGWKMVTMRRWCELADGADGAGELKRMHVMVSSMARLLWCACMVLMAGRIGLVAGNQRLLLPLQTYALGLRFHTPYRRSNG